MINIALTIALLISLTTLSAVNSSSLEENISQSSLTEIAFIGHRMDEVATSTITGIDLPIIYSSSTPLARLNEPEECSCITYARKISPYQSPKVRYAYEVPAIRLTPRIGAWAIFKAGEVYGRYGHIGIVDYIGTSTIRVKEFNFIKCAKSVRIIHKDSKELKGYFYNTF